MPKKRRRQRFDFWLSLTDRADLALFEIIETLKEERKFTQAVRNGLRLMTELTNGETSLLFELFPAIRDKLYAQMEADVLEKLNIERSEEMIHHIIELKGVISQIKNQPIVGAPMQGTVTMSRVTTTVDEEMVLEVKQAKGNGNATQNFLNSMLALQGDKPKPPPKPEPKQITGGLQTIDAPTFEIPNYDDDEDMDFFKDIAGG